MPIASEPLPGLVWTQVGIQRKVVLYNLNHGKGKLLRASGYRIGFGMLAGTRCKPGIKGSFMVRIRDDDGSIDIFSIKISTQHHTAYLINGNGLEISRIMCRQYRNAN